MSCRSFSARTRRSRAMSITSEADLAPTNPRATSTLARSRVMVTFSFAIPDVLPDGSIPNRRGKGWSPPQNPSSANDVKNRGHDLSISPTLVRRMTEGLLQTQSERRPSNAVLVDFQECGAEHAADRGRDGRDG